MRSRLSQLCWMIEWLGRVSRSASSTGSLPIYTKNLHISLLSLNLFLFVSLFVMIR
jgi:hypothetical protein